ncbi:hypothetical protein MCEMRE239_00002 [Candidatus Nanopelagicaceae bacterium]
MATTPHIFTHSSLGVSHSATQVNQGSGLRFYLISTAFRHGYYYYLYIYKSRFQADRFHIRFPLLQITYMDPRATA